MTSPLDFPPEAETLAAGAVLSGSITRHDAARGLATITTAAGAVRPALRSGEARLLAEIAEDARSRLALEPGVQAFALIKSVALAN